LGSGESIFQCLKYQTAKMIRRTIRDNSVGLRTGAGFSDLCKALASKKKLNIASMMRVFIWAWNEFSRRFSLLVSH
jgi:hypothetical protein